MENTPHYYDVIIIGAGAAGLMAAQLAGKRGKKVLVLEKNPQAGRKILISGGGRCNFTNLNVQATKYLSSVPGFCISALKQYPASAFISLVEQHGIKYYQKTLGQLFCETSSKAILQMLLKECQLADVRILCNAAVSKVAYNQGEYKVSTNVGLFNAKKIIVASGGLSLPKLGVSGIGYEIAQQFGRIP